MEGLGVMIFLSISGICAAERTFGGFPAFGKSRSPANLFQ
jgi:hypothetical protein